MQFNFHLQKLTNEFSSWPGGSVDWSIVPYTKRLQGQFLVRAYSCLAGSILGWGAYGGQLIDVSHIDIPLSFSLSPSSKHIRGWGLKKRVFPQGATSSPWTGNNLLILGKYVNTSRLTRHHLMTRGEGMWWAGLWKLDNACSLSMAVLIDVSFVWTKPHTIVYYGYWFCFLE